MDWDKIEKIAAEIKKEMGGDALEICSGDCAVFAKRMVDRLSKEGIDSVIVDNLRGVAMKDELSGYETTECLHDSGISHCYVKVGDWFFDAFDIDGCDDEADLKYHIECC